MDEGGENRQPDAVPVNDNSDNVPEQPHSTADYANYQPQQNAPASPKMPGQWRRWLIWAGVVIAVFALLLVGYKLLKKSPTPAPANSQTSNNQTNQTASPAPAITTATKNYSSQNFALSFDYPADWTVTDAGGGLLTAKSPVLDLKLADGSTAKANVIFSIRNKTQKLGEFDAGNATAERDSAKIAYNKPTQTQRGNTYISFLRYAKTASGLNEVCITGDNGYKAAQAIPAVDMTKVDPVICIDFRDSTNKVLAIASSVWDDPNFSTPLVNIFKSLVIT